MRKEFVFCLLVLFTFIYNDSLAQDLAAPPPAGVKNTFVSLSGKGRVNYANPGPELKAMLPTLCPALANCACEFLLDTIIESPGGKHIMFRQAFNGVKIVDAQLKINIDRNGYLRCMLNNCSNYTQPPVADFSYPLNEAKAAVAKLYPAKRQYGQEACYYKQNQAFYPAWRMITSMEKSGGSHEVFINASNGALLTARDRAMRFHGGPDKPDTLGFGYAFNPDPMTTAHVPWGGQYVWSPTNAVNLANAPVLDAQRKLVALRDIAYVNDSFRLTGPYVQISDMFPPYVAPPASPTGIFNYSCTQNGFLAVCAYYHIDTVQRRAQALGFNLAQFPLPVDPEGSDTLTDNSQFVPNFPITDSYMQMGLGGVPDAQDADVATHEYGHCLSFAASPGTNVGHERSALDEGWADFNATSHSAEIDPYGWQKVFNWDGNILASQWPWLGTSNWPGRSDATNNVFAQVYKDSTIWVLGELFSTAMMQLWWQEGKDVAGKLGLQHLYYQISDMSFHDGCWAVVEADSMLYGGAHNTAIRTAFCLRGVFTGQECAGIATVPALPTQNEALTLWPVPASQTLTARFSTDATRPLDLKFKIYDFNGKLILQSESQQKVMEFDVSGFADGLYLLQLDAGNGDRHTAKFMVSH